MPYFPDDLYEILKDRAGDNNKPDSKTKFLLEKGGATILKELIQESGDVVEAAMNQDIDRIVEEVADLWYHSLVVLLYYGLSPEQVQRCLIERHNLNLKKSDK